MSKYIRLFGNEAFTNEYWNDELDAQLECFGALSNINILVGANNSRKSRFMRQLIKEGDFSIVGGDFQKERKALKNCFNQLIVATNEITRGTPASINILPSGSNENILKKLKEYDERTRIVANFLQSVQQQGGSIEFNKTLLEQYFETIENQLIIGDNRSNQYSVMDVVNTLRGLLLDDDYVEGKKLLASTNKFTSLANISFQLIKGERDDFKTIIKKTIKLIEQLNGVGSISTVPSKIYIPILRNAINIYSDESRSNPNIYTSTIKEHYGIMGGLKKSPENLERELEIFTGLDLYHKVEKDKRKRKPFRKRIEKFENFLSTEFFPESKIEITAGIDSDLNNLLIHFGGEDDEDLPLHHLGDGIQSLIILLYPVFMANEGTWLFIEEPELHMHPGFQNIFLKTLIENEDLQKKNLKYFLTTHSNHLLDLSLTYSDKVSIFTFEKDESLPKQQTRIKQVFGKDTSVLDLLGVHNSSVFMANCSIWVEGVSDRRYISAFLHAYCRDNNDKPEFNEDLNYAFFEYAGSNIAHYYFSEDEADKDEKNKIRSHFLSNRIFLLADHDTDKEDRHNELTKIANGNNYFEYSTTREAVEVENILSPTVIKLVARKKLKKAEADYIDTWEFGFNDYKTKRLGSFLYRRLQDKAGIKKPSALISNKEAKNDTLTSDYKNKFSETVLKLVRDKKITWEMIKENPEAERITKAVYEFIKRHNK